MMRVQRGELPLSTVLVREKPPPWSGGEGGGKNRKFGKRKEPFSRDGCRVLSLEATPGFEPGNQGFADPCLTTWLCRRVFLFYAGVGGGNTYFRGVSGGGGRCSTGGPFYRWICPSAAPAGWCSGNEQLGRGSNPLPGIPRMACHSREPCPTSDCTRLRRRWRQRVRCSLELPQFSELKVL